MKKKILILVNKTGQKKKELALGIEKHLREEAEICLAKFSDITLQVNGQSVEVKIEDEDIRDFSLVYFRKVGVEFFSLARTLGFCLDHLQIPFFDTIFAQPGSIGDKLTSQVRLSLAGLPIPSLFFCERNKISAQAKSIISKLGLPLVAKSTLFHRGKGVFLVKNRQDFEKITPADAEEQFFFQKYCPAENEYRLLIMGGQARVWEAKIPTQPDEFRSNVALGAKEEFYPLDQLPLSMAKVAIRAAKTLSIQIAGVDLLKEKNTGKIWLLEVNRGPGLTYDQKLSPEIKELADFFRRSLKS